MSRLHEIKALFERGDYLEARQQCLQGIYDCQEYAFLHSGTQLENARDAELSEYNSLKNRVIFQEIRDYFNRKTHQNWNAEMLEKLKHFTGLVKAILNDDNEALEAHRKNAPGFKFFSEYKHLIKHLDESHIRSKALEILSWLKSLPAASNLANELQASLPAAFHPAQTPMADVLHAKAPIQLPLFPSQNS
jgi:hypothetical protein